VVSVTADRRAVERNADAKRGLEVQGVPRSERAQRRPGERLARDVRRETVVGRVDDGEAYAVHGDARAELGPLDRPRGETDLDAAVAARRSTFEQAADGPDDPGEHACAPQQRADETRGRAMIRKSVPTRRTSSISSSTRSASDSSGPNANSPRAPSPRSCGAR